MTLYKYAYNYQCMHLCLYLNQWTYLCVINQQYDILFNNVIDGNRNVIYNYILNYPNNVMQNSLKNSLTFMLLNF